MPRLVGVAKAKELIFCAKVLSGKEALEIGLAEYSVEQNEDGNAAYLKAIELAREIASKVCVMTSCTILTNENELYGVTKVTRSLHENSFLLVKALVTSVSLNL